MKFYDDDWPDKTRLRVCGERLESLNISLLLGVAAVGHRGAHYSLDSSGFCCTSPGLRPPLSFRLSQFAVQISTLHGVRGVLTQPFSPARPTALEAATVHRPPPAHACPSNFRGARDALHMTSHPQCK